MPKTRRREDLQAHIREAATWRTISDYALDWDLPESYQAALLHARTHFGEWPVADIKASDCRVFKARLASADFPTLRRSRSVEWVWQAFRAVLDLAVEDEALTANPAAVRGRRGRRTGNREKPFEAQFLTAPQVDRLCEALADREPYDLMVRFLSRTGLRASELAGLNVADVRLWIGKAGWRGYVEVKRTRRKVKGGWVEGTPKSEKSRRRVDMPNWLAEQMHDYLTTYPRADEPDAPLFPNRRRGGYTHGERGSKVEGSEAHGALNWSEPVEPSAFYRNVFKPALVAAGLPAGTRLHDLRHTAISLLLASGADPYWVSEQAGHSSYRVTLDVYAHFIPGDDDAPHPLDTEQGGVRTLRTSR